jgi:small-conductance mechanosensitive channel
MGVRVAPLLAGAGIVGIAIGFGAQKLVQDILSGIFFLIDDAFRKGEYIEIETLRGTVEKISLRSMQLRHHLGAVQTIPYGEIRTVRNLSRDWVTIKLEIRLPYDTDIEQVRKIIKKTGQRMLEHPEWGPSFILPLKSQGVFRVEESALIIRMKFTTIPGEQWVIRREAYRLVKEALSAKGIQFAHKEVFVRLPSDLEKQLTQQSGTPARQDALKALPQVAAAAVIASEQTEASLSKHKDVDIDES